MIIAIAAFLLIFNVFPMGYLVFKSFWGENGFTLETFQRIYSYSLNWTALKNTLLTATLAMI
ncbi:MAG: iron ABC transporter permease, partial [Synergistaceae bacterium]|nr:iron ABC transporter permease [Synergistaceae bacterium]